MRGRLRIRCYRAFAWSASTCVLVTCATAEDEVDGAAVYEQWCAGCHGVDGAGDGPAASTMLPRPRDFTLALYQIRTTATGELPTDEDIRRVIDVGMPGTAMPGWEDVLSDAERDALVEHLKTFSRFFGQGDAPTPLDFSGATGASDENVARGEAVYQALGCGLCHGQEGRGDGESAPTLNDDAGLPIEAADLSENWRFNGGPTVEDIYRRFRTGLDGTPMPTFSDVLGVTTDAGVITEDDLWALAHYVRSLSPEETPEVLEVVTAELLEVGQLPQSIDDPGWQRTDPVYVPLVGQIILKPRWFNPRVEGVWVQAAHDGSQLAMLVSWTDPSESPDPLWAPYAQQVIETMGPNDEGAATAPGAPDQLVVQFPQTFVDGMERPFFLQGDSRRPAYTWTWQSGQGAIESVARGMGTAVRQPDDPHLQHLLSAEQHADGQWKVLFLRALDTEGAGDLAFPLGQAVPMAFQAWDGDNGESGNQGAVSTWFYLFLAQPTPVAVFVAPPVALALTLAFGLLVVRQARRRSSLEWEDEDPSDDELPESNA